jgi:hypothetical protein
VPQVTMSVEEYQQLLEAIEFGRRMKTTKRGTRPPSVKKKRSGKKDPKMAKALRKANSMGRKKSGGYKKGWSQGKIMKKAHQLRRRM